MTIECPTKNAVLLELAEKRIHELQKQNDALQAANARLYLENQELKRNAFTQKPAPGIKKESHA